MTKSDKVLRANYFKSHVWTDFIQKPTSWHLAGQNTLRKHQHPSRAFIVLMQTPSHTLTSHLPSLLRGSGFLTIEIVGVDCPLYFYAALLKRKSVIFMNWLQQCAIITVGARWMYRMSVHSAKRFESVLKSFVLICEEEVKSIITSLMF